MTTQNSKLVKCQNCQKEFTIEPDDLEFYAKIKVPPPTWCPECRLVRKLVWRNERIFYKRTCELCGKSITCRN
ncbi:MAG: zinc-ribbon domain containing protein [Patescibacteria group bacterium]|nr:zinc-ribbon domain containing protein [Patescibacteria group bacterium]